MSELTSEALRERLEQQRVYQRVQEMVDILWELVDQLRELLDGWPPSPRGDMPLQAPGERGQDLRKAHGKPL